MVTTLETILSNPMFDQFFPHKDKLDRKKQIFEVVDVMTTPVRELQSRVGLIFERDHYFFEAGFLDCIIKSAYPTEEAVSKIFFEDICKVDAVKGSKNFAELYKLAKHGDMSKTRLLQSVLMDLIYDPADLYKDYYKYLPKEIKKQIGHPSQIHDSESLNRNPVIKEMQYRLIKDLIAKNKKYLTAARLLPANVIRDDKTLGFLSNLVDNETDSQLDSASKLMFGLLTHHVGYMPLPNFGKYESLLYFGIPGKENAFMDLGIKFPSRGNDDVEKDLKLQYKIMNQLFIQIGESLALKDGIVKEIQKKVGAIKKEHDQNMAIKSEYDVALRKLTVLENELKDVMVRESAVRADLTQRYNTLEVENTLLKLRPTNEQLEAKCANLEARTKKCESDSDSVRHHFSAKEGKYVARISELSRQLEQQGTSLKTTQKENEELKFQLYVLQTPAKYSVNIDGVMHRYANGFKKEIDRAVQVLSRDLNKGEVILRSEGRHSFKNLTRRFPGHDNFYKLRTNGYTRVIYTVLPGHKVKVLDAMNHEEYNRLCRDNN